MKILVLLLVLSFFSSSIYAFDKIVHVTDIFLPNELFNFTPLLIGKKSWLKLQLKEGETRGSEMEASVSVVIYHGEFKATEFYKWHFKIK